MQNPPVTRVEPRAARYLELLVEFGHLEGPAAEDVLFAAGEIYAGSNRPISLAAIQRLAAARLVGWDRPVEGGDDILSADWPLLFY